MNRWLDPDGKQETVSGRLRCSWQMLVKKTKTKGNGSDCRRPFHSAAATGSHYIVVFLVATSANDGRWSCSFYSIVFHACSAPSRYKNGRICLARMDQALIPAVLIVKTSARPCTPSNEMTRTAADPDLDTSVRPRSRAFHPRSQEWRQTHAKPNSVSSAIRGVALRISTEEYHATMPCKMPAQL